MLIPTGAKVLVDPRYDADKVYGLYIPDSAKNPMAQQGYVVSVGPTQKDIEPGDYILFHPFQGKPVTYLNQEYLVLDQGDITGFLASDGELFPLPEMVMITPDWKPDGQHIREGQHIIELRQVFDIEPPESGRIVRCGERVTTVKTGNRVVFPFHAGNEIGLDTGKHRAVYYTIREVDLLAIVEEANA